MSHRSESREDIRTQATKTIWSYATGMLALSVIFAPAMRNGAILPMTVVAGAAGGTAAVWLSKDKHSKAALKADAVKQLEERVANLETIAGTSDFDLEQRIKHLETRDRLL